MSKYVVLTKAVMRSRLSGSRDWSTTTVEMCATVVPTANPNSNSWTTGKTSISPRVGRSLMIWRVSL